MLLRALGAGLGVVAADRLARRNEARMACVRPLERLPTRALVDVVVPARDEAAVIGRCVAALTAGPGAGRVVVVDDGSGDGTGAIATAAGASVVRLDGGPPAGWTGKTHALGRGVASLAPAADWLAFVDADVALAPGALAALVAHAEAGGLDAVSPLLRQRCGGLAEALVVPLAYWQWAVGMAESQGGPARTRSAVLNGQCLVVRRDAYDACGGHAHAEVRGTPVEDAALARLLARCGGRTALVRGAELGSVRMYASAAAVRRGFLKNAGELLAADWRRGATVAATGALLSRLPQVVIGAAMALRRRPLLGVACLGAGWVLPAATLAPRYRDAGVPAAAALTLPLAAAALQVVAVESLARHLLRRPAVWKGRRPPARPRGRQVAAA